MPEAKKKPKVPAELKKLLLGYLNTCQVMTKLWFRAMAVAFFLVPAGFYASGDNALEAGVNGIGLWIIAGIISRFLVFEFRQLRASRVARRVDQRIPRTHPTRDAVIEWIGAHNDGNFLNSVLKKLGVPPRTSRAYITPLEETVVASGPMFQALAEKLLGTQESAAQSQGAQTYVYATTQTQMLNEDGEWVTVHNSTTTNGDGAAEPPPDFKPIPLSPPRSDSPRAAESDRESGRRSRSLDYMPLQLDDYVPRAEDDTDEAEATASPTESECRR